VKLDGGTDMKPADMRMSMPDLVAVMTGCHGYVECLKGCGADATCAAGCDGNVTTSGTDKYQMALSCGQQWCLDHLKCRIDTTQNRLVDYTGCTNCCIPCLQNSLALLFGDQCVGTTDCNPAMCTSLYNACLSDLP
jgi:hypothetical protein